jgi:hypothetical protein
MPAAASNTPTKSSHVADLSDIVLIKYSRR